MVKKRIINPQRVRRIKGGFSFIPHRFITDGYWGGLGEDELMLYLFLVTVSDRYGLSFYSAESICSLTHISHNQYSLAREGLIEKDLIAFDGMVFQVLELPNRWEPSVSALHRLSKDVLKGV